MASESPAPRRSPEVEAEREAPARITSPVEADERPPLGRATETQGGDRGGQPVTTPADSNEDLVGGSTGGSPAGSASSQESGEVSPTAADAAPTDTTAAEDSNARPPQSDEAPPLPDEQPPPVEDDGWDFQWDQARQAYFFYNRFTNAVTWDNPRLPNANANANANADASGSTTAAVASTTATAPSGSSTTAAAVAVAVAEPPKNERPPAGGYNPAIHGDYDPNAWYAKNNGEDEEDEEGAAGGAGKQAGAMDPAGAYAAIGSFNRFTGKWQAGGGDDDDDDDGDGAGGHHHQNPDRHSDEAKSRRQMNAFFDVDAAANSHDGRSLKAERSGKKPTKAELKAFKEKRRAKKEEKRRAWLRD